MKINLESVLHYKTAYDLIRENSDNWDDIPEDLRDDLRHVDDWEPVGFLLINYDTVLCFDTINGDISGEAMPLDDFVRETLAWCREEM